MKTPNQNFVIKGKMSQGIITIAGRHFEKKSRFEKKLIEGKENHILGHHFADRNSVVRELILPCCIDYSGESSVRLTTAVSFLGLASCFHLKCLRYSHEVKKHAGKVKINSWFSQSPRRIQVNGESDEGVNVVRMIDA